LDGVIHAAATFSNEDEATERRLLDGLLPFLRSAPMATRFIYTGGCWLFGPTAGSLMTEDTSLNPPPAFAWGVAHIQRVLDSPGIESVVIHPAMVYEPCGGVFGRFRADAIERDAVRIVGGEEVRWPLVHSEDLASLYRLALEASAPGQSYIGAAIEGIPVGRVARAFARRYCTKHPEPEIISEGQIAAELGDWARGYALDQRLSGAKARRRLGWNPRHLDPETEIASIP